MFPAISIPTGYVICSATVAFLTAYALNTIVRQFVYNAIAVFFALLFWKPIEWVGLVSIGAFYGKELVTFTSHIQSLESWWFTFLCLFAFKFFKVAVHTISYISYYPTPIPAHPTYTSADVTVIIPTVGDLDAEFVECIGSVLACNPASLIISTVGLEKLIQAQQLVERIGDARLTVVAIDTANKRTQVMAGVNLVKTRIVVLADDHVFWPRTYLNSTLACFEDPKVGHVGTVKRVRRQHEGGLFENFLNFIATIYLERHNFECTASHNIDGGVFVISGRTAFLRASIIQDPAFQRAFLNETWFFGVYGPLNVDDDNFITRYMVTNGHKVVFHNSPLALMQTTLGQAGGWVKFRGQLDRWARTTVRSNTTTLLADRTVYTSQPWSVYAVFFSALINFAVFYDLGLFISLYLSPFGSAKNLLSITLILFISKLIKPFPHYWRRPEDLKFLPAQILFGYYHSWVKLHALLTCYNVAWGTRANVDGPAAGPDEKASVKPQPITTRELIQVAPGVTSVGPEGSLRLSNRFRGGVALRALGPAGSESVVGYNQAVRESRIPKKIVAAVPAKEGQQDNIGRLWNIEPQGEIEEFADDHWHPR